MVRSRMTMMAACAVMLFAALATPHVSGQVTQAVIDSATTEYVHGSGESLPIQITGQVPDGGQVLAIAWSDAASSMVAAFHPVITSSPWAIPASELDLLPLGRVDVQLLVQSSTGVVSKTDHWITVNAPPPPPPATFGIQFVSNATATYQQGSSASVAYTVAGQPPANSDVLVLAWSDAQMSMLGNFAYKLAPASGVIASDKLDQLPLGRVDLQVLLRVDNKIVAKADHWVTVSAAPVATPQTTINFDSDAPTQFTLGSTAMVGFVVNGPLPTGGDVLVQAWSDTQQAIVAGFVHKMTSGPWRISSAWLDSLPTGNVQLQLLLRSSDNGIATVLQTATHDMTIIAKTVPPLVNDPGPQIASVTGLNNGDVVSGSVSVEANVTGELPNRVVFTLFHNSAVAQTVTDTASPYTFPANGASWNAGAADIGSYMLYVDVYADGGSTASDEMPISFSVKAPPPVTPPGTGGNESGWTTFTRTSGTQVIYVSSSQGNDSNNGTSADYPVKTAKKGMSLIRDGKGDWLLFRRGDTFDGGLNWLGKSGASQAHPLVIGNYGNPSLPRPWFKCDNTGFVNVYSSTPNHIAIVGLRISDYVKNPSSPSYNPKAPAAEGIRWIADSQDLLIENCVIEWFQMGVDIQNASNVRLRRDVIRNCYANNGKDSSGAFLGPITNLLVEGCVFDQNGYIPNVGDARTIRKHDLYTYNVVNAVIRNNIIARASAYGLKVKGEHSEGASKNVQITGNLFLADGNGMTIGQNAELSYSVENITLSGNVFADLGAKMVLESGAIADEGLGLETKSIGDGTFNNNIFVNTSSAPGRTIWALNVSDWRPQKNIVMSGNIIAPTFHCTQGPLIGPPNAVMSGNVTITNSSAYVDPTRDVASYDKAIGGPGTLDAFLQEAVTQQKGNWRAAYTPANVIKYIQAGMAAK